MVSDLVGFDVAGFDQLFPACEFRSLVSSELLRVVGHNLKAQIQQFGFDLWVIQTCHDGRMQFGFDIGG